eukprot:jgi/Ulvmu1/11624/UM008_0028.1
MAHDNCTSFTGPDLGPAENDVDDGVHSGGVSRRYGSGPAEEHGTWAAEGSHDNAVLLGLQPGGSDTSLAGIGP